MENMKKMFGTMSGMDKEQMMRMMECMPTMGDMCKFMNESGFAMEDMCCSEDKNEARGGNGGSVIPPELKSLFDEWVRQVREEIEQFKKENSAATRKDIADHLKLSEQCIEYFMGSSQAGQEKKASDSEYETLKIRKTQNSCSLCEDYVQENESKPIVVMSCEGACLRGEIARKAANILCHTVAPEQTVRLCLGSALTKEAGQRSLVLKAKRLVALEGCPVDCGSRMIAGLADDIHPEVIRTDVLADFDKDLFGINEMSEEDINKCALKVALTIAEKIKGNNN